MGRMMSWKERIGGGLLTRSVESNIQLHYSPSSPCSVVPLGRFFTYSELGGTGARARAPPTAGPCPGAEPGPSPGPGASEGAEGPFEVLLVVAVGGAVDKGKGKGRGKGKEQR